jgi:5-formaminoimidazole-4-carboxamide-1-beta-D-ribofuranosyl 5'-monophosphate synthetase
MNRPQRGGGTPALQGGKEVRVVGNISLALRESLLPEILELGMKFVKTTQGSFHRVL